MRWAFEPMPSVHRSLRCKVQVAKSLNSEITGNVLESMALALEMCICDLQASINLVLGY
jgi:hypothetical protein